MGRSIVETPLGVTNLAGNLLTVLLVGRMAQRWNEMLCPAGTSAYDQGLALYAHIGKGWDRLTGTPAVAGATGEGCFRCMAAFLVAIDACKTTLPMDIRSQIVPLHPIRPGNNISGGTDDVRRAVFPVVVMFVSAIVITADVVTIMATQALSV